ncbi:MAG: hypothetical protein P1V20_32455 [Verrucomicrobiales bacterium]|nr:hypothetical protein [Verrucomicrobiales bacterium]
MNFISVCKHSLENLQSADFQYQWFFALDFSGVVKPALKEPDMFVTDKFVPVILEPV